MKNIFDKLYLLREFKKFKNIKNKINLKSIDFQFLQKMNDKI